MIGQHFGLVGEYVPMPYFNVATRKLTADEMAVVMPAGQPIVDLRKVVSSYRFDAHQRLVVGSIGEVSGPDGAINRQWVSRKITRLFPTLRNVSIEYAWAGRIGVTDNHMPTVHAIGKNAFALGGYNGRGIAAGTVFAEAIANVIAGKLQEHDLPVPVTKPRGATKLPAIRGKALRAGAAAFHMIDARKR
jgi:glycine/D-amino acid oxidase-like deaminating enzyme